VCSSAAVWRRGEGRGSRCVPEGVRECGFGKTL